MKKDSDSNNKDAGRLMEKPGPNEFLIVGIGASAGGIQALQEFFTVVPQKTGIAYVVILHLSPDYDSQLTAVLQRHSKIPVKQVTDKDSIKPDHIYVVSPNKHLKMEGGTITATTNILMEERRAPVDIFFRTMADEYGVRAIAVILSGTGANGSMGLKRVKERGGACFVQNPREAEFNEMPRSAISTQMVDEVLPVAEIPQKIIAYKKSSSIIEITDEPERRPDDQQQALREIFTQLRIRTGHDFTNYKRPTLLRRIERRINISGLETLPDYAAYLHENPEEPSALLKDLLISVTNFFRDKKPFDTIEKEVLPLLFKDKTNQDHVRIWVPGCATGEEAYSLAILCAEVTLGIIDAPKVQIFATDIDEAAIAHAREGLYSLNDAADVSPDRIRRFFNKEGDMYRIRREIRETIMFAAHNFLKDPPFSHLDMVSCRNVMIYLNQVAQERVIETFHFALKPGAFLFLGTSESVDGASDLYSVYNRENHIFQRRQVTPRSYPIPESTPTLHFEKFKNDDTSQEQEKKILDRISFGDLHQQLLEEYAPPSLVINEEFDILHLTERAGKYLQITGGEPSKNLLKLIRPELRLEVRSALYQSTQRQSAVEARGLKVTINDKTENITVKVRPVLRAGDTAKGFILVVFEPGAEESNQEILVSSDEPLARQLEEELIRVKIQLRTANEQHDFQAEEMKASNEELQAMNEELRSAAEELETSKEELQSINEELRTVNQELKVKIEETSIASNNLQNIINSTDIGTIFLDRSFRVALYTPAASAIFNLIPADHGRPLTDITHKLEYSELQRDAETVLEKLNVIEKEVRTSEGNIYLMRLTPYRTDEDRINGIIITFVNITERKNAEAALRTAEDNYRLQLEHQVEERTAELKVSRDQYLTLVENTPDVITRWDKDLKLIFANSAFEIKTGENVDTLLGKTYREMGQPEEIALSYCESLTKAFTTGETVEHYNSFPSPNGEIHFYSRIIPEKNALGEVETVLATARDITYLKTAAEEIKEKQELLQATMDSSPDMIQVFEAVRNGDGDIVDFNWILNNHASEEAYGNVIGKSLLTLNPGVVEEGIFDTFKQVVATGKPNLTERHYQHEQFNDWFYQSAVKLNDGIVTTTIKITDLKKAEQEIKTGREFLRSIIDNSLDVIQVFKAVRNKNGEIVDFIWLVQNSKGFEQNQNVIGDSLLEKNPGVIEAGIFDRLVQVVETGIPLELEQYYSFEQFDDSWFYQAMVKQDDGVVMTTRNITQQIKAEKELMALKDQLAQKANDRYLELFNSIDEGFCIVKVLFDENGKPNNYRFLEANEAFKRQTGIQDAVGLTMKELAPAHEEKWFEIYGRIAKTLQPERFESEAKALGYFYEVYAFSTGNPSDHLVAILFNDITERKKEERKQRALLELSDTFRPLSESSKIKKAAMELGASLLEADSACYYEIADDQWNGAPYSYTAEGVCPLEKFPASEVDKNWLGYFLKNEYLTIENVDMDSRFSEKEREIWDKSGIKSGLGIPLVKKGKLTAVMAVHNKEAREWTEEEIILLQEIAHRTWTAVDRAHAEEELRISKEKYHYLFDSIDEGYCIIEVLFDKNDKPNNWKFVEVNPAFEKNNGLANAAGKTILDMAPDIEDKWFDIYGKVAKTGQPLRFTEDSKALKRHFDLYAFPVGKPDGNLVAVIFTDISKRVTAEQALRQSEERLRVTMKSAIDFVIITIDVDGNIDQWNSGAELILGYTADEVKGKPFSLIFTEEDQADNAPEKELQAAREKGYAEDGRWHRRKDGSHFFMNGIIRPIYNPELTGYAKVARDMTGQQQAQEQLRVFEERSRIALESAGMASWDWNIKNDIINWNENHYTLLGIKPQGQLINAAFFAQFVHPEDQQYVMNTLTHAVETAGEFLAEFRVIRADNVELWMKGYGSTVSSEDGRAVRMIGVMFDVTEQKRFMDELSRQVKERTLELERSNDDLRQFAHVASHDLKEPVRKIRTFNYRILEEFSHVLPENVKSYLQRIESAASRMYMMIDGVLHYSKLDSNNDDPQTVDINKIIENIQTDLELMIENKEAVIAVTDLPVIQANDALIYQLFYNLILNSLKFGKAGEPVKVEITASEVQRNNQKFIQIQLKDNGIGFNPEHAETIFNTFTRLHSSDRYEGSGLGLALCKKIVARYQGSITAESNIGNGALFTILLPIE